VKAILSKTKGGPETLVLEDVPEPRPGPGEVKLAVKACGVDYRDLLIIDDLYQDKPGRPFSPGGEVSGVVEEVGAGVTTLKAGDVVLATTLFGGMAEKMVVDANSCVLVPETMPLDVAAGFPVTYGTAYYALKDRGRLKTGETLLVLGAAGGAGLAAVEIGKALGARVIAAVSSEDKLKLAKRHGADAGLVYPRGPFDKAGAKALADQFKAAVGESLADVVYDPVGGDYSEAALRAIAWYGRFLVIGFPSGIPRLPLNLVLLKSCDIVGVAWGAFTRRDPAAHQANVRALFGLYTKGLIRPEISERYPLSQAGQAIARLAERKAMGKIVVIVA
jgi:NADPH2:quinone reductase